MMNQVKKPLLGNVLGVINKNIKGWGLSEIENARYQQKYRK